MVARLEGSNQFTGLLNGEILGPIQAIAVAHYFKKIEPLLLGDGVKGFDLS